jgi:carboxyl-terminal processing protease
MINRSAFSSIWQSKLARRGAIFTEACLLTLVPIYSGSATTTFTDSPKAIVDEVWQVINTEYVDSTFNHSDWQKTRTELLRRNYHNRQEAYTAIRSSLKQLGDKYTRFMNPQEFQSLNTETSGAVSGVGIKMESNPRTQQLVVVATVKNSPAAKAGIKPGDAIIAIDGKSTLNISLNGAIALIRGETGKSIVVKIARGKMKPFDIPLTRAPLEVTSVFTRVKQEGKLKVGYIKLLEFSANSASQMETAIKDLNRQKVNAYVLDLRDNPGGLVHICIQMARMWLDNGTIVKTVDRQGNSEISQAYGESLTRLPLAVLVDGNSASASEILAAALQDNHRATIVGSQTFGKALVQAVHPLADGSGMAVTVAHYYTPNGTDIGHKGVTPDVKVELNKVEQEKLAYYPNLVASKRDPQYQRAIVVLKK